MLGIAITLTLAQALGPYYGPHNHHTRESRRMGSRSLVGQGYAFFEFAPLSGQGMTETCACTTPTGAKGETLTFTRTGNATCSKQGLATTGINDGDLVVCAGNNQPRVEPDSDGVRGLRVEGARTNYALHSQNITVASGVWVADLTAPTITSDYANGPDGTQTAERFQFPAANSRVYQLVDSTTPFGSIYVRGTSGSGSIHLWYTGAGSGYSNATTCSFTSDSWSRCGVLGPTAGSSVAFAFGCHSGFFGMGACAASDVLVTAAQTERGAFMTSPIPTAGAAVSRNAETAYFTLPSAIGPSFSAGVSMWWPSSSVGAVTALQLGTGAPDLVRIGRNTNTAATLLINATTTTPAVSAMGTTQQRGTLNDAAGTRTATWQGASVAAPAASMTGTVTAVSIGALDGIASKVCVDPVDGRCTP